MYGRKFISALISALLLSVITVSFLTSAIASSNVPVGINLGSLVRWNTDWPLVDEMKRAEVRTRRAAPFYVLTDEGDLVDWDENGWPQSLPADSSVGFNEVVYSLFNAPYTTWEVTPPPAGIFQVMYEGEGTLVYRGGISKLSGAEGSCGIRCDRVFIDPAQIGDFGQQVDIAITATNTNNHLRNIRVIWPGGICDDDDFSWHQSDETCNDPATYQSFVQLTEAGNETIFHPDFLRDLRDFQAIRFLNWQQSNSSTLSNPPYDAPPYNTPDITHETTWADRRQLSFATWAFEPTETPAQRVPSRGAPIEAMVSLINKLDSQAWFHIPFDASDTYIQEFATLVKNSLQHDQRVYIEYGNEAWNGGWPFNRGGDYLAAKGDDIWADEGTPFDRQMNYFAKRTKEICSTWKSVWGADADQLTCVMGSQAAAAGLTQMLLDCPLWANSALNTSGENCASVDAVAIAPYFGDAIGHSDNESQLINWTLNDLFTEINEGGVLTATTPAIPNSNVPVTTSYYHSAQALLLREMTARLSGDTAEALPPLLLQGTNLSLLNLISKPTVITASSGGASGAISALDIADDRIASNIAITNNFGLELLAYEGGQHMLATGRYDASGQINQTEFNTIANLFTQANRDPRMGATYVDYLNRWKQLGGGLFTLYSSVTPATSFGSWGLKESLGQASTPKRTAAQQMLDGTYCWGDECSKTLTDSQWHQISIPCEPGANNSVADFFQDDIAAPFIYGTDWVLFRFDPASGAYVNPGLTGIMSRGIGYWMIQLTGSDVEIDTPASCTMTAPEPAGAICTASKGCFEVPLATKPTAVQWNLSGYGLDDALPFNRYASSNSGAVPTLKITSSDVACSASGCLPNAAEAASIVHNQLWRFNPQTQAYDIIDNDLILLPWDGFWVPTLSSSDGSNPAMLLPDY